MSFNKLGLIALMSVFIFGGVAFGQNIQTNTSATTQGSTDFGFEPDQSFIERVINQDTTAGGTSGLTCGARIAGILNCSSTNPGANDAFVREIGLPGSWTDSARAGILNTSVNFACGGRRAFSTSRAANNSNICNGVFSDPGLNETLAPNLTNPTGSSGFFCILCNCGGGSCSGAFIPPVVGTRDFIGVLTNSVSFGTGSTSTPNGFSTFTLRPGQHPYSTGANGFLASIDQFIESTVSLGGAKEVVFRHRDSTLGAGSTLVPELVGASISDATAAAVIPTIFVSGSANVNPIGVRPWSPFGCGQCTPLYMNTRTAIQQDDSDGAGGGFGGLNLDVAVQFHSDPSTFQPGAGSFLTPGLNTGDPTDPWEVANVNITTTPEWRGFTFP